MEVTPVVMTCMATGHKLLESTSKVKDSEYFIRLSSLSDLSEAKVITRSCLGCSCSFGKVDGRVESTTEIVFALLWVMTPKVPPLAARMPLFFALVAGIA
ncbi:hypothetical protein ACFX13_025614 [Malus domestica]